MTAEKITPHYCQYGEQCPRLRKFHNAMRSKVRVYDNGGLTIDRYTVIVLRQENGQRVADVYGMSENAGSPQGFNQYSHTIRPDGRHTNILWNETAGTWGKRIRWQELPQEVLQAIADRL